MYFLTILLFCDISILNYYIKLRLSVTFCLSSGDTWLSLGISSSFVTVYELFWGEVFETFVILSAIFLPIKLPVASAVFLIVLYKAVLNASAANFLEWSRRF